MPKHFWRGTWSGRSPSGTGHQRAREILRPTGGIMRGKFPSRKNGRMVQHEGLLELDAIYLFEAHPRVAAYREQPCTVRYPDGARLRRYTPDFEVVLTTGETVLIEIKPRRSLEDPDVRHKLRCIAEHFTRINRQFVVLDCGLIRMEPRLASLRWICHHAARVMPSPAAALMTLLRHKEQLPTSFRTASQLLAGTGVDPASLLLMGLLRCDLDAQVTLDTLVRATTEDDHDWFCISQEHGF